MSNELKELRRRFSLLRDEELLKILTARRAQYRQSALDAAAEELTRRGVAFRPPPPAAFTPYAQARPHARPAGKVRGWEFWLGIFLIGGACLSMDKWIDGMTPGVAYDTLRVLFIVLLSFAGGRLMKLWETVD